MLEVESQFTIFPGNPARPVFLRGSTTTYWKNDSATGGIEPGTAANYNLLITPSADAVTLTLKGLSVTVSGGG